MLKVHLLYASMHAYTPTLCNVYKKLIIIIYYGFPHNTYSNCSHETDLQ